MRGDILYHLSLCHTYIILYVTPKVKCYFKKSNQYRGVFHALLSKSKRVSLPLTLFPYHKLLKVSIVSSVFIPPPDFPEPPLL